MRRALSLAEVEAGQIDFVEAHGTGTVLGDMIEANALGDVHKTRAGEPCMLGSVKGNIGHTEGSAGIAAFIKTCLALHHGVLPPTVFGDSVQPGLAAGRARAAVGRRSATAAGERAVLGAVSSFGLGGSNAHAVLESAPASAAAQPGCDMESLRFPRHRRRRCGLTSSRWPHTLRTLAADRVGAWCRSTNVVKRSHRHRVALAGDRDTLVDGLQQFLAGTHAHLASAGPLRRLPANVGLLFSGQGTQYPGMTRPLYEANRVYRKNLDPPLPPCDPHVGSDLLATIFGGAHRARSHQPRAAGVVRRVLRIGKDSVAERYSGEFGIGHSVGEITAACLAGVLTVDTAARLVVTRGRLMGALPPVGP